MPLYDFDHTTGEGQIKLMYLSVGIDISEFKKPLPAYDGEDYGADPIGDGTFKMIPSGDIVGLVERNRRMEKNTLKIKGIMPNNGLQEPIM